MEHFGLRPAVPTAIVLIAFEFAASRWWPGASTSATALVLVVFTLAAKLLALRFWKLEPGMARQMTASAFFGHLGRVDAFIRVAGMSCRNFNEDQS